MCVQMYTCGTQICFKFWVPRRTACQHLYPRSEGPFQVDVLKGADALVYASGQALGLDVAVVPVWNTRQTNYIAHTHMIACGGESPR